MHGIYFFFIYIIISIIATINAIILINRSIGLCNGRSTFFINKTIVTVTIKTIIKIKNEVLNPILPITSIFLISNRFLFINITQKGETDA